jgi:hypothetical protein
LQSIGFLSYNIMSNVALHSCPCACNRQFDRRVYRPLNLFSYDGCHAPLLRSCRVLEGERTVLQEHTAQRRGSSAVKCAATSNSTPSVTLFPAGKKQARVKIPACFLKVSVQEALSDEVSQILDEAVSAGITGLWLVDEGNEGGI